HSASRALALLVLAVSASAGQPTDYALAFEPGGKRWSVEVRLDGRGEESLDFRFSLWTPGAYHVADYGRFVKELEAADENGAPLTVEHGAPGSFVVKGTAKAKTIVLRYKAEP